MIKDIIKRISVKYLETELKKLNDELDKKTEETIKYREEISNFKDEKDILSDKLTCLLNNVSDKNIKTKHANKEAAKEVGTMIAKKALEKNIKTVVFDRGGYIYHGVVKELAEAAREGGLEF